MAVRVGVNGFGRIGMLFTKAAMDRGDIEVVAANDLMPFDSLANLFKHDSTHGIWHEDVSYDGNVLHVGDHEIKTFAERDPAQIPWGDVRADIVVESTGVFTSRDGAAAHIEGGAKKVIISAPGKGVDATFVYKVNHEDYDPEAHEVVSNASCTTNCIIPMVKVIQDNFGIDSGYMTTVHAYTNDKTLLDAANKDPRRDRSAPNKIVQNGLRGPHLQRSVRRRREHRLPVSRRRRALGHPGVLGSPTGLQRHRRQQGLVRLRLAAHHVQRRYRQGARLVRQRVGLLEQDVRPGSIHGRQALGACQNGGSAAFQPVSQGTWHSKAG